MEIEKVYEPQRFEPQWARRWVDEQLFRVEARPGVRCDWSRERFSFEPHFVRAVRETFVQLYEKGLIYQGDYMVNWCPRCRTVLSDLEVEHEETQGSLWHLVYPVNGSNMKLVVATTRPETMLGDTGVAINPNDKRAEELHLKSVRLPL